MKRVLKRAISILLSFLILTGVIPMTEISVMAAEPLVYSIGNEYTRVNVSTENGGFSILTEAGDKLNKADDNKKLLYHRGEYDTSFTSFEVTYNPGIAGEHTEQYIFGGNYGFLGMSGSDVAVTQNGSNEILAKWSLDDLTFTQSIMLANAGSNEHGMVSISYTVSNKGSIPVSVKARVLLDTALGNQDYAYYEVIDASNSYRSIKTETVLTAADSIPQNFFGYDDPYNPTLTAYTVNAQADMPYQAAFGHWNNLAATLFDFSPDSSMDFTNMYNYKYMTADSAYALYYDLSTISGGASSSFLTYYGIYSHNEVPTDNSMIVDVTSPASLSLNGGKTAYVRQSAVGIADFSIQAQLTNFMSNSVKDYSSVTLAVYTAEGLMPLDANGAAVPGLSYDDTDPYTLTYSDILAGETISDTLYFKAQPVNDAKYSKIRLEAYDTSANATITTDKLLGSAILYILCPGTNGDLPTVTFTSLTPDIIYCSGTRHMFLTGTNIDILYTSIQNGSCVIKAFTENTDDNISVALPKENILQPAADQLDIILTDNMVTGSWYLQLEWSDNAVSSGIVTAANQKQTAPALNFTVTDDKAYKNDTYGVIAVVQTAKAGAGTTPTYRIRSFSGESTFKAYQQGTKQADGSYLKEYTEILLVFRGEFDVKETTFDGSSYVPTVVTATSLKSSVDARATNSISINNCMDFENGVLTISYSSTLGSFGDILAEFDGELYTSDARTSIWDGEAAFTKIEQGKEFSLIPYDENGVRSNTFTDTPISLVWPSVYGAGQTIAGMVFNLAYGQMGVMKDNSGSELGRVLSFSAKLDLGFLIPGKENGETENTYWTRLKNFWRFYNEGEGGMYSYWAVDNVDNILDFSNEVSGKDEGSASVMVKDILYGCGAGFVGVHFNVEVALPNYAEGMPKIQGTLEVNTIGNWSFGIDGKMEMATFTLEVSLAIKSYNNIPVPDKIYFFIGGFEPGINVDGCGVIWITGGGGGIDKLYDTIFLNGSVPPLKILLSVSFDLLKVLSARADLSLSLRGISFTATDVKIKATNIVAIKKMAAEFDWYPDLYLMSSVRMSLFDLINGSGYIVLQGKDYTDWFFEAFVRATVQIPNSIPIVGGMEIAQADLGINTEKIWGALKVLFIKLGVTYYWGSSDIDFGAGSSSSPTYPNLLSSEDIPVCYDAENDRILYMKVGTNLNIAAQAEISDEFDSLPRLMGMPLLSSNGERLIHSFNLGTRSIEDPEDAIVQISYSVTNDDGTFPEQNAGLIKAKLIANSILSGDGIHNTLLGSYGITLYDGNNIDTANGNVTYDASAGKGTFSFTMTADSCYDRDWSYTTPVAADVILYNVASVPEITSVSGTLNVNGSDLSLFWSGTGLSNLDSASFYLVPDKDEVNDSGYALTKFTDSGTIASGSASVTIPAGVPSGEYYIRTVFVQDGVVNSVLNSNNSVIFTNSNTPSNPSVLSVSPGGDLKFEIGLCNPSADGYVVNIYEYIYDEASMTWGWEYSDINNLTFNTAELVNDTISVGGSYIHNDNNHGLSAGTEYRIGITAVNFADSNGDGRADTSVCSSERYYSAPAVEKTVGSIENATSVTLPEPTPPDVSVKADVIARKVTRSIGTEIQNVDTYISSDITFAVASNEAITGTWFLDEGNTISGTITNQSSLEIVLNDLSQGDHTLVMKGQDSGGDGFRNTYLFTVDTLAPKLLLTSPTNGSFFNENGTLTVAGSSDSDALFTVLCDDVMVSERKSISALGGDIGKDGTFSFTVPLPDAHSSSRHHVIVIVADAVGNMAGYEADVYHAGLSDIKEINVYADGVKWSNGNINTNLLTSRTSKLSLVALTEKGVSFALTNDNIVSWNCFAVKGTASVTDDGELTMGPDSVGYVTGALRVAASGAVTAGLTFGAECYGSRNEVVAGAVMGGSVIGGGKYSAGDTVTLNAIPDAGYFFTGWTIDGVVVGDTSLNKITFIMPDRNVVAEAGFSPVFSGRDGGAFSSCKSAAAGKKVSFRLPEKADENCCASYYMADGERIYVAMSKVSDGSLVFIAPVSGTYYFEQRNVSFTDTAKHWSKDYITFVSARNLFNGIGNNRFNPDGTMTRAMFVTVLWRLAGKPSAGDMRFGDVGSGEWYSEAVAWAAENGIVNGYNNGFFGVKDKVTREQMCVMILRYLEYAGFRTGETAASSGFEDDALISPWAADAVKLCQSLGIINGKNGGIFDPSGSATRAEGCATFSRLIKAYLETI